MARVENRKGYSRCCAAGVLLVTSGWKRAARVRKVFEAARLYAGFAPLPLWVTTFAEIREHGSAGAIWRSNRAWEQMQWLPCFSTETGE